MNTADLCPEGRELWTAVEYWIWVNSLPRGERIEPRASSANANARQAYRQHVDGCAICKGDAPARPEPVTAPFKKR